jgi:predicted TIM-barrel fold metal-dependent hydrolase
MDEPIYFDACAMLGRHVHMTEGQAETAEQLLAAMDHFGIHEALVLDPISVGTNPLAGNARILKTTADHPRLHPAWVGLLTHSREIPPPDELVAQMREAGVGALFLFYGHYRLPLDDWAADDLLAELAASRVPVFLCPNDLVSPGQPDVSNWPAVVRICQDFPELPVIVTESRIYRSQRPLYEALATCPNLKVDLSALWVRTRVEFITREFGPGRIVWGSQLPTRTPGSPLMQLNYSDVSAEDLAAAAGGTLRELMAWNPNVKLVEPGEVSFPPADGELHRKVRERESFRDERFYDCHGHIGWGSPYHVINDTPQGIVAEMDRFGLDVCTVFAMQILADNRYGNDEVMEVVRQYPDRFLPFTFVNPHQGERLILEELQRGLEMGMKGIKLICAYLGYPPEGPMIDVAARFAHEHKQFILNHDWGSPARMLSLCQQYPDACFIQGHSTFAYADVCRQVENLFICTCPFLGWNQTEDMVAAYGAERILFGSDLTDLPIAWGLGQVLYARITEADKRKILGENYLGLMRKYGLFPAGFREG